MKVLRVALVWTSLAILGVGTAWTLRTLTVDPDSLVEKAEISITRIEGIHPGAGATLRELLQWAGNAVGVRRASAASDQREPRPALPDRRFAPVEPTFRPLPPGNGRILRVGAGQAYATPSAAARAAKDGDIIEIDAGDYAGDTAIWTADDLTLRGRQAMVWLDASGTPLPQRKAIWIIQGDRTTVENIAFLNARSPDRNGAGIRHEGTGLVVRNCYFLANENGILTGSSPDNHILIEHSEFAWNGHADGQAHNLYIGNIASLTFRFNYVHHAVIGSQVKSRARENHILFNRIGDERDGYGNYALDLSNGGLALVIGNVFHQSAIGENFHLLTFAPEGAANTPQRLYVVNNTFVNERGAGVFVRNNQPAPAHVYNNLFIGEGTATVGEVQAESNLHLTPVIDASRNAPRRWRLEERDAYVEDMGFADPQSHDYRLVRPSPAVDSGATFSMMDGVELTPAYEYVHPRGGAPRPSIGAIDIGAHEFRR